MGHFINHRLIYVLGILFLLCSLPGCTLHEKQIPPPSSPEQEQSVDLKTSPPPSADEQSLQPPQPEERTVSDLLVIGEVEPVTVVAAKITFPARIDTGATTSSLDAQDIVPLEKDGKKWVRFSMKDRKTGKLAKLEAKVTRVVEIKRHGAESQKRLAVKLKTKLGPKQMESEFTLADRSTFTYPVLIGRNILEGNFLVDVSQKNTTSLMKED